MSTHLHAHTHTHTHAQKENNIRSGKEYIKRQKKLLYASISAAAHLIALLAVSLLSCDGGPAEVELKLNRQTNTSIYFERGGESTKPASRKRSAIVDFVTLGKDESHF